VCNEMGTPSDVGLVSPHVPARRRAAHAGNGEYPAEVRRPSGAFGQGLSTICLVFP